MKSYRPYSASIIMGLIMSAFVLNGCFEHNNSEYQASEYENIFMPESQGLEEEGALIVILADSAQTITYRAAYNGAGGSSIPGSDIPVQFDVKPALVDSFNTFNGTSYPILPEDAYELSRKEATIPGNELSTDEFDLNVKSKDDLQLEAGSTFLLPVTLSSTEIKVNESKKTTYFLVGAGIPSPVEPAAGDGSEMNPYEISTFNNLIWITQNTNRLDKHYIQTGDIDASASSDPDYNDGQGFNPIGSEDFPFEGSYDGQGHTIDALYINRPSTQRIGLFGSVGGSDTEIKNLGVTNVDIGAGDRFIGGLVGYVDNATISNSYTTGLVSPGGDAGGGAVQTGGLAGRVSGSTIENSYSSADVTGYSRVGGFAGRISEESTITNCHSRGNVTSTRDGGGAFTAGFVGMMRGGANTISLSSSTGGTVRTSGDGAGVVAGFVGRITGGASNTIEKSYSSSDVVNTDRNVGGFVADISGGNHIIQNSYSTGTVEANRDNVGGFVGRIRSGTIINSYCTGGSGVVGNGNVGGFTGNHGGGSEENCYWNTETSGQSNSDGSASGKTSAQMKQESTYTDWDFNSIWTIDNGTYPYLQDNMQDPVPTNF